MEVYEKYKIDALNVTTGAIVKGCSAYSIRELSHAMPLFSNGSDYALMHSDIQNPDDWVVVVKECNAHTGAWEIIDDPRIYAEDLTENLRSLL